MDSKGFTVIELLVSSIVIAIMAISLISAYVALNSVAIFARQKTTGTQLATNRIEYLKSLPYDNLAVAGGAIPHPSPLPNSENITIDNTNYEIKTSINYIDDAFDGCGSYPTQVIKDNLCRNLPEPTGATNDTNPADYKIVNVKVLVNGKEVSELDTNIAARVAETNSTTGSLVVTVIDSTGSPVSGATVQVINTALSPSVNVSDSSDVNGVAIFYGLPPHSGNGYTVSANKTSYSNIFTITPTGGLSPNFASQNIIVQQSSSVTLTIDPMGKFSLLGETLDTNGTPISNMRLYVKGGQKKYSDISDTSYYFDNQTPTDNRPTTDSSGNFTIEDLSPGNYIFCGDLGVDGCQSGSTSYYLVAAIPYTGTSQIGAINIPPYTSTTPPSITFPFGSSNYYQKARIILSTDPNFPRINSLLDTNASKAAGNHSFTIKGDNLNGASVIVKNSGGNMSASCTGSNTELICNIDPSSANTEQSNLTITANGYTLDIPNSSGLLGGVNVTP